MKSRMVKYFGIPGLVLWVASALALGQTTLSIPALPGTLNWQNTPRSWNIDRKNLLTISSNPKSDWFVDPFDGTVANSAPILFFTPGSDYVLSARVTVKFATKLGRRGADADGRRPPLGKTLFRVFTGRKTHTRHRPCSWA
jgi:hypothetical protein